MIELVAALLFAGDPSATGPSGILARGGAIQTPPPMEEQVRPYKSCLLEQFGRNPRLRVGSAEGMRVANAEAVAACAEARQTAAASFDATLRSMRAYRNTKKRQSRIEKYLSGIDRGLLPIYLATTPAAQSGPELTDQQAAIVYDQCLARAATRASRTEAADTAIFGLARGACEDLRSSLGAGANAERARMLDAMDTAKETAFPELTRKAREQRRAFESRSERPN